jgi:uroporphyrin-III C-methyltransferase
MPKGKVSIIGAGPGDVELLTLKAAKCLREADVVFHDSLISEAILALIPKHADKFYVGKRLGDQQDQTVRQNDINRLLIEHAKLGKACVRLKSGDPFMFGRGVEEVRATLEAGLDVEVIPGITAGIAAADLCHVPITERHKTTSVLFCTGHTADYDLEHLKAVAELIKSGSPLVLYMGLKNLEHIVTRLQEVGISGSTSICAISRVSYPDQSIICGTLETICHTLSHQELNTPAIFLIGEHAIPVEHTLSHLKQELL